MSFSSDERDLFQKAVAKNFGDLATRGFTIGQLSTEIDALIGEQLVIEVQYPDSGRGAQIAFFVTNWGGRALSAFLHKGGIGGFMVSTYLKFKGVRPAIAQQLQLSDEYGPLSDRVDAALKATRAAIDEHLLPALTGGEWPVVPVDWGDYK